MALSILGVALGVAVVVGIDLANTSARMAFRLSTETVAGRTTHVVVAGDGALPDSIYRQIRLDTGVRDAAPVLEGYARLGSDNGPVVQILGIDPLAEAPFRSYTRGPGSGIDLGAFMTPPFSGIVSAETADSWGITEGESIGLAREGLRFDVELQGFLETDQTFDTEALANLLVVDISTAQSLLGAQGQLSRVDLILPGDEEARTAELSRIQEALPSLARIETASARSATLDQMTEAFTLNLTAMSLLAMVVGMFLIYNTMTFS
ncbi:MAG: ABC transporter permease, partial [Bacteroidota bacterium]|nr:ABC transporter permease [Bacteroidota bacterium]